MPVAALLLCISGKNSPPCGSLGCGACNMLVLPTCAAAGVQGSGLVSAGVLVLYSHKFYPLSWP